MEKEEIKQLVEKSIKRLLAMDEVLIHIKVKEECINHRLACHFEKLLYEDVPNGLSYDVDVEFNKNYVDPKRIIDEKGNDIPIRPDIIVHERKSNCNNLVVFEIKKNYTGKHDLMKVRKLCESPYNYSYGCLISYLPGRPYVRVKLISKDSLDIVDVFKVYN